MLRHDHNRRHDKEIQYFHPLLIYKVAFQRTRKIWGRSLLEVKENGRMDMGWTMGYKQVYSVFYQNHAKPGRGG